MNNFTVAIINDTYMFQLLFMWEVHKEIVYLQLAHN
jgi:hypothetical protein